MQAEETALILVGYQNDYFAKDGIQHGVIAEEIQATQMLEHTMDVLEGIKDAPVTIIHTPILFSPDYCELPDPAGLMAQIRDLGAFRRGTRGGDTIAEIKGFGERILTVAGKTGFNAFGGTGLADLLDKRGIENVVLLGVVTSICIDSTGRAASEYGYKVTVLADCHAGRSKVERDFYNTEVFPLYGEVMDGRAFLAELH